MSERLRKYRFRPPEPSAMQQSPPRPQEHCAANPPPAAILCSWPRRSGAALHAEPNMDFGFFWVTAVTVDGQIVVANSYGLAYIPEGVNLPEHVRMASADESIPVGDRAKWATCPILAVQGWAQHHKTCACAPSWRPRISSRTSIPAPPRSPFNPKTSRQRKRCRAATA